MNTQGTKEGKQHGDEYTRELRGVNSMVDEYTRELRGVNSMVMTTPGS